MGYLEKAKELASKFESLEAQSVPASEVMLGKRAENEHKIVAYSKVLGREIVVTWTGMDPKVIYVDRTPYTPEEIAKIKDTGPNRIKTTHLLKENFQGTTLLNED